MASAVPRALYMLLCVSRFLVDAVEKVRFCDGKRLGVTDRALPDAGLGHWDGRACGVGSFRWIFDRHQVGGIATSDGICRGESGRFCRYSTRYR
jgi:hypothetical protein